MSLRFQLGGLGNPFPWDSFTTQWFKLSSRLGFEHSETWSPERGEISIGDFGSPLRMKAHYPRSGFGITELVLLPDPLAHGTVLRPFPDTKGPAQNSLSSHASESEPRLPEADSEVYSRLPAWIRVLHELR